MGYAWHSLEHWIPRQPHLMDTDLSRDPIRILTRSNIALNENEFAV